MFNIRLIIIGTFLVTMFGTFAHSATWTGCFEPSVFDYEINPASTSASNSQDAEYTDLIQSNWNAGTVDGWKTTGWIISNLTDCYIKTNDIRSCNYWTKSVFCKECIAPDETYPIDSNLYKIAEGTSPITCDEDPDEVNVKQSECTAWGGIYQATSKINCCVTSACIVDINSTSNNNPTCPDILECVGSADLGGGSFRNLYDVYSCVNGNEKFALYTTLEVDEPFDCFNLESNNTTPDSNNTVPNDCTHSSYKNGYPFKSIVDSTTTCNTLSGGSLEYGDEPLPNCSAGQYACFYHEPVVEPEDNETEEPENGGFDSNVTVGPEANVSMTSDGNGSFNIDMTASLTRLDTINSSIGETNTKLDKSNSELGDINTKLVGLNTSLGGKLDGIKTAIEDGNKEPEIGDLTIDIAGAKGKGDLFAQEGKSMISNFMTDKLNSYYDLHRVTVPALGGGCNCEEFEIDVTVPLLGSVKKTSLICPSLHSLFQSSGNVLLLLAYFTGLIAAIKIVGA